MYRVLRAFGGDLKLILYIFVLCLLGFFADHAWASPEYPDYQYKGVYPAQNVLLQYCSDCWLSLPPEFLQTDLVLSISTDDKKKLFRAIVASASANGWELSANGNNLKAVPIQNDGNLVFISCMSNDVQNVPKYLYSYARRADSLKCAERDSLRALELARADSLRAVPPLPFVDYELRYFSFTKSFADKMGVDWSDVLAGGNLRRIPDFYDNWRLYADQNQDTSFNFRSLFFSLDSSLNIDWGSEEQTLQRTYNDNGVITSDYEWRKYGIIIKIERTGGRVKLSYILRDKDNSVSVLQGSAIAGEGDTLFLQGNYNVNRRVVSGVPFLASIPILGYLFSTENVERDSKYFNLFLIPTQHNKLYSLKVQTLQGGLYAENGQFIRSDSTSIESTTTQNSSSTD